MLPRYLHPPLVEAVYEVFVQDSPGWSKLSEQRLEQQLAASFSGKREVIPVQGAHRVRLWNQDRSSLVQFSAEMAAFNVLAAGYLGYEAVVPSLQTFLQAYLEASQPTQFAWLGQRYLNKIELPAGAAEASDYFHYYPRLPAAVGNHRPFALQVVSETFDGGEVVLNLTFKGQHAERPIYFLGIYARSNREIGPRLEDIMRWQTTAHEAIRRSFTAALTDHCRLMFDKKEGQP